MNSTAYIKTLIESFPALRRKVGREFLDSLQSQEFDSKDFAARFAGASTSESQAAVFVRSVWGGSGKTELGEFRFVEALSCWDSENRAAFVAWCSDPQWP